MGSLGLLREKAFNYKVITPPTNRAVTLDEFKAYAKISSTADDATIAIILDSAIAYGQQYTRRIFIDTEFETFRDEFICRSNYIELRRSPFDSLSTNGFQYRDQDDNWVDVDSSIYDIVEESDYSEITLFNDASWPDIGDKRDYQNVRIRFTAGYGADSSFVPAEIKNAIMIHALFAYQNRGDCDKCNCDGSNLPSSAKTLYDMYRIIELRLGW